MPNSVIKMSKYGKFLQSREEGLVAFNKINEMIEISDPQDKFIFDFDGVLVLAPSYCDEVLGQLNYKYPNRIIIGSGINHALQVAIDTVEETRGMKFVVAQ